MDRFPAGRKYFVAFSPAPSTALCCVVVQHLKQQSVVGGIPTQGQHIFQVTHATHVDVGSEGDGLNGNTSQHHVLHLPEVTGDANGHWVLCHCVLCQQPNNNNNKAPHQVAGGTAMGGLVHGGGFAQKWQVVVSLSPAHATHKTPTPLPTCTICLPQPHHLAPCPCHAHHWLMVTRCMAAPTATRGTSPWHATPGGHTTPPLAP